MARRTRRRTRRANVEVSEWTYLPGIIENLQELAKREIHIGVQGDAETAMIAGIHEYGSVKAGIPARPFIGSGRQKAQAAISKAVRAGVQEIVLRGKRPDGLYQEVGTVGLSRVLKNFDKIKQPPLSPIYARRKSGKKILQDQQKLRDAMTFTVVTKRGRR